MVGPKKYPFPNISFCVPGFHDTNVLQTSIRMGQRLGYKIFGSLGKCLAVYSTLSNTFKIMVACQEYLLSARRLNGMSPNALHAAKTQLDDQANWWVIPKDKQTICRWVPFLWPSSMGPVLAGAEGTCFPFSIWKCTSKSPEALQFLAPAPIPYPGDTECELKRSVWNSPLSCGCRSTDALCDKRRGHRRAMSWHRDGYK